MLGSWWKSFNFAGERGVVLAGDERLRMGELDRPPIIEGGVLVGLRRVCAVALLGDGVCLIGELLGCATADTERGGLRRSPLPWNGAAPGLAFSSAMGPTGRFGDVARSGLERIE